MDQRSQHSAQNSAANSEYKGLSAKESWIINHNPKSLYTIKNLHMVNSS